ncbi:MAG: methyltransferase domain-containing protein [Pseudonocardia sp.]|jgi:SAM-dependent methyltransferase
MTATEQPHRLTPSIIALDAAELYERRTTLFDGWRTQAVEMLGLRPGDTVLDVGCGPGSNLDALRARVGPIGRILAMDECPELLDVARYRVERRGWHNVELTSELPAAGLPSGAHAALLCAADDVLQSPTRLAYLMTRLRPGARVVAGGWKLPAGWLWPLRAFVAAHYGPMVRRPAALNRPWGPLTEYVPDLTVTQFGFGTGYLAAGTLPR